MSEELDKLVTQFNDSVFDLRTLISEAQSNLDRLEDRLYKTPKEDFNKLLEWGFVPNQKVKFKGSVYTFKGFSVMWRMIFANENGEVIFANVDTTYKHLAEFEKLEEEK